MSVEDDNKVEPLFIGDMRCDTLFKAVREVLYERGNGLPVPSVLGVLDLLKHDVITNHTNLDDI